MEIYFILIYIMLAVLLLVQIVTIVMVTKIRYGNKGKSGNNVLVSKNNNQDGIVFCKSCGNQFSNSLKKCSNCGTEK